MSIEISELRRNDVDVVTQLYIEVFAQRPGMKIIIMMISDAILNV